MATTTTFEFENILVNYTALKCPHCGKLQRITSVTLETKKHLHGASVNFTVRCENYSCPAGLQQQYRLKLFDPGISKKKKGKKTKKKAKKASTKQVDKPKKKQKQVDTQVDKDDKDDKNPAN